MKKQFILLFAIINILLLLSSCSQGLKTDDPVNSDVNSHEGLGSGETISNTDSTNNNNSTRLEMIPNTIEAISEKYPGKAILTISCNGYFDPSETVSAANEYLSAMGKEYVIYILPVEAEYVKSKYSESTGYFDYNSEIEKILDTIDIILTDDYRGSVEREMLLPLDEYIKSSKLSSFIPEKLWSGVSIDGTIYGIDLYSQVTPRKGYFICCETADKYGFDLEKPIAQQIDVLKAINDEESSRQIITFNQFFATSYYLDSVRITDGVCIDAEGNIKSILDDNGYISFLKEMFLLNKEELVKEIRSDADMSNFFAFEAPTCFTPESLKALDYAIGYSAVSGKPKFTMVYPVFSEKPKLMQSTKATGISVKSKHTDYAFDFLETVFTDFTLNNIMCYGNYYDKLSDDGRILDSTINKTALAHFSNGLITLPTVKESLNKKEDFERTVEALEVNSDIDFTYHVEDLAEEQEKVHIRVYEMSTMLLKNDYESFEEYISVYKAALSEAGLDRLIEDAAARYKEWKELK